MGGIIAPDSFPIRKPTDPSLVNGRNVNPPRYNEVGGLKNAAIWRRETGDRQSSQGNIAAVKAPTNVRAGHSAKNRNDD